MADINAALTGLKCLRDFMTWVGDLRKDADVLGRVNDAMAKVGEVQDKLYELREENLRILEENRVLSEKLRDVNDFKTRRDSYRLTKTAGGATVLYSEQPTPNYACPSCAERGSIQVLQDKRVASGSYECPGCKSSFPVEERKQMKPLTVTRA